MGRDAEGEDGSLPRVASWRSSTPSGGYRGGSGQQGPRAAGAGYEETHANDLGMVTVGSGTRNREWSAAGSGGVILRACEPSRRGP